MDISRGGPRSGSTAVEASSHSRQLLFFLGAVVALAISFVLLIAALSRAFGGGDGPTLPGVPATPGEETPAASVSPNTPGSGQPTAAIPATPDPAATLPCGDILVPLNKTTRLASDCVPNDLRALPGNVIYGGPQSMRAEAADAMLEMLAAAERDGYRMFVVSSYRSYATQEGLFNYYVQTQGLAQAERSSARPGRSEHQLGTTADVSSASAGYQLEPFTGTAEADWIAENSWKFGFVVSYPNGSESITGYMYEPWHVRYVGKTVAAAVNASGRTLHEYLNR